MRNLLTLIAILTFAASTSLMAQGSGQYAVQVGAFLENVGTSYFKGLSNVYVQTDQNDIRRYYVGNFSTLAEAEAARKTARDAGYPNARVIDFEEIRRLCAASCALPVYTPTEKEPSYLESIFFDFDKSNLRAKSRTELDKLYQVLIDNPTYKAELRAHTDAKGSNAYNDALSQRRADAARNYLVNRGISGSRLVARTYGEESPIAKNELDGGVDSPEGRQFNRRVELVVLNADGGEVKIVRDINVPGGLRYIGG